MFRGVKKCRVVISCAYIYNSTQNILANIEECLLYSFSFIFVTGEWIIKIISSNSNYNNDKGIVHYFNVPRSKHTT